MIYKKFRVWFLTIIFSLIPIFASSNQIDAQLSADEITVEKGEILYAVGNVLIKHGKNEIKADSLKFFQKTNQIEFTGLQNFDDGKGIRLTAEDALINGDLSEGIIRTAHVLLDNTIKIHAEKISLKNGEVSSASGISRVTSCEECEGKKLSWYLAASSAQRDIENSNIVYRNVTVRIKGVPIAYIPYLRMPDPSVDRAMGFLVPEAVLTSNLATGLKLPYFIPVGLSSDLLITPYISSKTNTLEYRYRQKFRNGDLTVKGAFSNDNLVNNNLRFFSQTIGKFRLGYGINLNFNAGKVSDTSYLGDYVYNEESDFNSEISLGKTIVDKMQFFDGRLNYLRKKENINSLSEYYSLSGSYIKNIFPLNLPGNLRLSADLNSSVNVNDDNSISRPPSSAQVGIVYNNQSFLGPIRLSSEIFGDLNSFVNSADAATTNEEFAFQYGALAMISAPQTIKRKNRISFFDPKIAFFFNNQNKDILGDYFIGSDELSWGNLYEGKKIMSLTESELGFSFSVGLENKIFWATGSRMDLSVAASKINDLTYASNVRSGLDSRRLNYLGKISYTTKNDNLVSANSQFSSEGRLLKGNLKGRYSHKNFELEANYEILDQAMDKRLSAGLKTIDLSSSYNLSENFIFRTGGRYDLTTDQNASTAFGFGFSLGSWEYNLNQKYQKEKLEKFSLSAIYDDECTRFTFSFENRYQELGSSEPVKLLMFRVQLKPFANVIFSQEGDQIIF